METNRVEIVRGPSKEKMDKICEDGKRKDVKFDIHYSISRIAFVDILEIISVQETSIKILASMPNGFFMYSQGEDPIPDSKKLQSIQVHIFYTTNTRMGYIEKIPNKEVEENNEPRLCPRCKGRKVDPYRDQDDCHRCGGVGKVYGLESNFNPSQF